MPAALFSFMGLPPWNRGWFGRNRRSAPRQMGWAKIDTDARRFPQRPFVLLRTATPSHLHPRKEAAMTATATNESSANTANVIEALPKWPTRTIALLATVDDEPHAIPVSAPVRAGDHRILLSLRQTRGSLSRLR